MQENKIIIEIDRPLDVVFEFTTNPKNTHLWVDSITEEVIETYPPKIGTQYKNRGKNSDWNHYLVEAFQKNSLFMLSDLDKNYHVQYKYRTLNENKTELEYFEWMEFGELKEPFSENTLKTLKSVLENTV